MSGKYGFQRNLNISTSILTARLKTLVSAGILERKPYQANPPRDLALVTTGPGHECGESGTR